MHIFLDESGAFAKTSSPHRVCSVAALVVPEPFAPTLLRKFRELVRPWRGKRREVKGSALGEVQMAAVLRLLRRFDVLVFADAIDMGQHSEQGVERHKFGQAEALTRSAAKVRSPELVRQIHALASSVSVLSSPLYVQATLLTDVVDRVVHYAPLYYAQRIPSILGAFRWRVDAKDHAITPYEQLWIDVVRGFLQTASLADPALSMVGANYAAFEPFAGVMPEPPEYLRNHLPPDAREAPFQYLDLNRILADVRFCRSDRLTGIQLADIVASAITRACNSTIKPQGWAGLGRLMLQDVKGKHTLRFLTLQNERSGRHPAPYAQVVRACNETCKKVVAGVARSGRAR